MSVVDVSLESEITPKAERLDSPAELEAAVVGRTIGINFVSAQGALAVGERAKIYLFGEVTLP